MFAGTWTFVIVTLVSVVVLGSRKSSIYHARYFSVSWIAMLLLFIAANGIYQNSLYGLAASFPPRYTNAIIIGNVSEIINQQRCVSSLYKSYLKAHRSLNRLLCFRTSAGFWLLFWASCRYQVLRLTWVVFLLYLCGTKIYYHLQIFTVFPSENDQTASATLYFTCALFILLVAFGSYFLLPLSVK